MPLFAHAQAAPERLRGQAAEADAAATVYVQMSHGLLRGGARAAEHTSPHQESDVEGASRREQDTADALARASILAAAVLRWFADAVDDYNSAVDALNNQWDSLRGSQEPSVLEGARRELIARERQQRAELEDRGDRAADLLTRGPSDPDVVVTLMESGHLPSTIDPAGARSGSAQSLLPPGVGEAGVAAWSAFLDRIDNAAERVAQAPPDPGASDDALGESLDAAAHDAADTLGDTVPW